MSSITSVAAACVSWMLLTVAAAAGDETERCADFYTDSTPGTVRISTQPIDGTWQLLPYGSSFNLEAGGEGQFWLVYNHKGAMGDGPSYLAAFEVTYLEHRRELASELSLYRNDKWKREEGRYKAPKYRNELRRSVTYALPPGQCAQLLNAYRTARTYDEIDDLLATDVGRDPIFDGEPYKSKDTSLVAARALSSVTLNELQACSGSGVSCMCQLHYMRFTPMQGKTCSDTPVDWYSSKDVSKSVFYMYSPHTPNMTGRIEVTFGQPTVSPITPDPTRDTNLP